MSIQMICTVHSQWCINQQDNSVEKKMATIKIYDRPISCQSRSRGLQHLVGLLPFSHLFDSLCYHIYPTLTYICRNWELFLNIELGIDVSLFSFNELNNMSHNLWVIRSISYIFWSLGTLSNEFWSTWTRVFFDKSLK